MILSFRYSNIIDSLFWFPVLDLNALQSLSVMHVEVRSFHWLNHVIEHTNIIHVIFRHQLLHSNLRFCSTSVDHYYFPLFLRFFQKMNQTKESGPKWTVLRNQRWTFLSETGRSLEGALCSEHKRSCTNFDHFDLKTFQRRRSKDRSFQRRVFALLIVNFLEPSTLDLF